MMSTEATQLQAIETELDNKSLQQQLRELFEYSINYQQASSGKLPMDDPKRTEVLSRSNELKMKKTSIELAKILCKRVNIPENTIRRVDAYARKDSLIPVLGPYDSRGSERTIDRLVVEVDTDSYFEEGRKVKKLFGGHRTEGGQHVSGGLYRFEFCVGYGIVDTSCDVVRFSKNRIDVSK